MSLQPSDAICEGISTDSTANMTFLKREILQIREMTDH